MKQQREIYQILLRILAPLILFIACARDLSEEYASKFNVYSILRNDVITQKVIVDRIYKMDEPSAPYVSDALIILSSDNLIDTLKFSNADSCYVTNDTFALQPLNSYRLSVIKEDFDTLFAKTRLPDSFEIIVPHNGDTLTILDTIIFKKSTGAAFYKFSINFSDSLWIIHDWLKPDTLDSLIKIYCGDYFGYYEGGNCLIKISACDSNYYKYVYLFFEEYEDSLLQAGVEGGVGLLGSAWVESVSFFLRP